MISLSPIGREARRSNATSAVRDDYHIVNLER
jgi:hypothetical protein